MAGSHDEITSGGTLVTKEKVKLPEVLDVLIVGGGPAGTGAAFRAKELGLSALLIDRDAILSILRDWISPGGDPAKDKKVDSSYGPGGKRVPFPAGGALVDQLVFGDQVPASEVYNRWMQVFHDESVPARAGLDLTNLAARPDGTLLATCVSERTREEVQFVTRSAVFAMGRGVPTKLAIPGDTTGIYYKLREPEAFVGGPACVIGGGTSAAEAVIAISEAKVAAGDDTDVIWSYRRRNLPKVNSTLADTFFKAYTGNGNIRYLRYSGPLAVLKGDDGGEYVALRYDRREQPGRPAEGTYLEFPKERVLACIGADLPIKFLNTLGIYMLRSADLEEDLMAVTPLLESQVPNVFLIGDLLSPAYIESTDFNPEEVQSTVIDHIGNFKQGMTDGCLVMEVVRKRLDGMADDEIAKLLLEKREEYAALHKDRLQREKEGKPAAAAAKPAAAAAPSPPPAPAPEPARVGAKLARVISDDNVEPKFFPPGRVTVGHSQGDMTFPADEFLVDDHVALEIEPDACYVEAGEGTSYLKVNVERTVPVGQVIIAGDHTLRVESTSMGIGLSVLDPENPDGPPKSFIPAREGENIYGRHAISPDPKDKNRKLLSRRHFTLQVKGTTVSLRDFGSINGTFIPIVGTLRLNEGDEIHAGSQRFRFDGMEKGGVVEAVAAPPVEAAPPPAAAPEKPAPAAPEKPAAKKPAAKKPAKAEMPAGGDPALVIANAEIGDTVPTTAELSVLEKLMEAGLATDKREKLGGKCQALYSCKSGSCGLCVIRVVGGADNVSKANGKEKRTLKTMVETLNEDMGRALDPAECRLACLAKVTGPVEIELLGDTDAAD